MRDLTMPQRLGVTLGGLFALMHAAWIVVVAAGFGGVALRVMHATHFVSQPYTVIGFDTVTAFIGVVAAFTVGFILGWIAGRIWLWTGRETRPAQMH